MSKLNTRLLKCISHGDCIVLIGSGVSVDSGYPSWQKLSEYVFSEIDKKRDETEDFSYWDNILKSSTPQDLMRFFDFAEKEITKGQLVEIIKKYFDSVETIENETYSILANWPVECYLTTNYDSEIKEYLNRLGLPFVEKGNSNSDFMSLRTDSEKMIFKIHGTFDSPETFILTKSDYDAVMKSEKYKYWREKIKSIFQLCNLILIGYSAKDPDFVDALNSIKNFMNPEKPIYMFAADLDRKTQEDLYKGKNIVVIDYKTNESGSHSMLRKVLKTYSAFLPERGSHFIHRTQDAIENNDFTSAMFIYDEVVYGNKSLLYKALNNCILTYLKNQKPGASISEIISYFAKEKITTDKSSIKDSVSYLLENSHIEKDADLFKITEKGLGIIQEIRSINDTYRQKFLEYSSLFLKQRKLQDDSVSKIVDDIDKGLEVLFRKRGIDIAKKVIIDDTNEVSVEFDVAEAFYSISNSYTDEESDAFIDLMLDILEQPDKTVRDYLALLCNKYFMFHILGHDKQARQNRLDVLKKNKVFIDSNIMLPLLAKSCQNNKFAVDLINDLKSINTELYITNNILKEIEKHAYWAISNFSEAKIDNLELYKAQMGFSGYKENLFISGGMVYCSKNGIQNIDTYFEECLGENYKYSYSDNIRKVITEEFNISILDKDQIDGFSDSNYGNFEDFKQKIEESRRKGNSFRSDLQCETEAELLVISQLEEISFLTTTTNLKKFDKRKNIKHWSPESLYRFLQANSSTTDLDDLFNCMVSDIYDCGLNIINKEDLKSIASPFMKQAELNLAEIKKQNIKAINGYLDSGVIESEKQDYTLPFYVDKLENLSRKELLDKNKKLELENAELIKEKGLTEKERNELERFRQKKQQKQKRNKKKSRNSKKKRK